MGVFMFGMKGFVFILSECSCVFRLFVFLFVFFGLGLFKEFYEFGVFVFELLGFIFWLWLFEDILID